MTGQWREDPLYHSIPQENLHQQEAAALYSGDWTVFAAPYQLKVVNRLMSCECSICGETYVVEKRTYLNLETSEETIPLPVRTACLCIEEYDPYKPFAKPDKIWSNPGSFNGIWLYPVWMGSYWDYEERS